jgi:hypothetical protein
MVLSLVLTLRLERDITKILSRIDEMDAYIRTTQLHPRPAHHPRPTHILTPPEDEVLPETTLEVLPSEKPEREEDSFGSHPVLLVSADAIDSIKQNHFYALHKALNLDFEYPNYFQQDSPLDSPFASQYEGPLPRVSPEKAEMFCLFQWRLINSYLDSYLLKIHTWFPFLDPRSCKEEFISKDLKPERNSKYCMFLMLMALGSMAQKDKIEKGLYRADKYAKPAFAMLPMVMMDRNLRSVHCFILFRYSFPASY